MGLYLKKHPDEKAAFFGLIADTVRRIGSAKPVNHALQELALYVGKVRHSLVAYFTRSRSDRKPILQRHIDAYREEVAWHIRRMERLEKTYGSKHVREYQVYLRDNWSSLSVEERCAGGIEAWLRQVKGMDPERVKERCAEDRERQERKNREARSHFLAAALRKLRGGSPTEVSED